MNKSMKILLAVAGVIVIFGGVLGTGVLIGRASGLWNGFGLSNITGSAVGPGMMYGRAGAGAPGPFYGPSTPAGTPLTIDQARQAVEGYLAGLNNSDLELKEIMVFDNNAYARVIEKSTGIGAMELLVDPATLAVFPEYGPNMMWNLKYGHMSGNNAAYGYGGMSQAPAPRPGMGGRGGMMGGYGYYGTPPAVSSAMTVTPEQAVNIAQQYLDTQYPGYQADPEPDAFYGYYTIDILKDDQPTGMLSVNGFSGQVFLHTWHGSFITQSEF
jgi:hypothetical protein